MATISKCANDSFYCDESEQLYLLKIIKSCTKKKINNGLTTNFSTISWNHFLHGRFVDREYKDCFFNLPRDTFYTEIPIKKYPAIYIAVGVVNKNMEVLSQICVRGKKVYCHMIFD